MAKAKSSQKRRKSKVCYIKRLPPEVLSELAKQVHNLDRVNALSLVNHKIRHSCLPFLFKNIKCTGFIGLISLVLLQQTPYIKYVETLSIRTPMVHHINGNAVFEEIVAILSVLEDYVKHGAKAAEWSDMEAAAYKALAIIGSRHISTSRSIFPRSIQNTTYSGFLDTSDLTWRLQEVYESIFKLVLVPVVPMLQNLKMLELYPQPDKLLYFALNNLLLPFKHQIHLSSFSFDTFRWYDDALTVRQVSALSTLGVELNGGQTPHTANLYALMEAVRPTLKHLRLRFDVSDWQWGAVVEDFQLVIGKNEEWPLLQSLSLKTTYSNWNFESHDFRLAPITFVDCPSLKSLHIEPLGILFDVALGPSISTLTSRLDTSSDSRDLRVLGQEHTLQHLTLELHGLPQPLELDCLFRALPQIQSLEFQTSKIDPKACTLVLVEAALINGRASLHPTLQKITLSDARTGKVHPWFSNSQVLRRIFPSIKWYGFDAVAEDFVWDTLAARRDWSTQILDQQTAEEDALHVPAPPKPTKPRGWSDGSEMNSDTDDGWKDAEKRQADWWL